MPAISSFGFISRMEACSSTPVGAKRAWEGYLIRCLREEPTGQGEGVDADIQQRAGKWAYGKWSWPPPALHDVPGPVPPLLRVPRNLG